MVKVLQDENEEPAKWKNMICFSTKAVFGKVISVCGCGKNVSRDKIVDINKGQIKQDIYSILRCLYLQN